MGLEADTLHLVGARLDGTGLSAGGGSNCPSGERHGGSGRLDDRYSGLPAVWSRQPDLGEPVPGVGARFGAPGQARAGDRYR